MKKVLIIAYYFPPLGWSGVQRTLKFVKYLRGFNWEPIVVTVGDTPFRIKDKSLEEEIPKDIQIIRVNDKKLKPITDNMQELLIEQVEAHMTLLSQEMKEIYTHKIEDLFEQIRNLILVPDGTMIWANEVIQQIDKLVDLENIDIVFSTSAPYSAHVIGYYLKNKYDIPWVADFRDEWSNNPYYDYEQDLRREIEFEMEQKIVQTCDRLITFSTPAIENFRHTFNLSPEKIELITNGYDEEDFRDVVITQNASRFKISYNGTFYLKINPYSVLEALNSLIAKGEIAKEEVVFEAIGTIEPMIMKEIQNKDIYKVMQFIPYMEHKDSLVQISDAHLVVLVVGQEENLKGVYTGKVFEYLRLKKPILALAPLGGVVDELISETETGQCMKYEDVEAIQTFLLNEYSKWKVGKNIKEYGNNQIGNYERRVLTSQLANVFNQLINEKEMNV